MDENSKNNLLIKNCPKFQHTNTFERWKSTPVNLALIASWTIAEVPLPWAASAAESFSPSRDSGMLRPDSVGER